MAQSAHKYTLTLNSTSITVLDYAAEAEEITVEDVRADIPNMPLSSLRRHQLPGIYEGTVGFTLIPETAGADIVSEWNQAVEAGELVTAIIDQVALGTESPAPSSDNPRWTFTFFPKQVIGGPVSHGDKRMWVTSNSIVSSAYDFGAGDVPVGG